MGYVLPRFANTPRFLFRFQKALLGNCAMEHPVVISFI
jgi:predicted ATPase